MCDYKKIREEYVFSNLSLRELRRKHGVNPSTLMGKAFRDGWRKDREEYRSRVKEKTMRKLAEKQATAEVKDIELMQTLVTGLLLKAGLAMEDLDRGVTSTGKVVEGRPINSKDIKNLASALRDLADILGYASRQDVEEGTTGVIVIPERTVIGEEG